MAKKQTTIPPDTPDTADAADASVGSVTFDDLTFEQALAQLEAIVAQLETGDLTLEQSLNLHARGQVLAELCARQLDSAELQVRELGNA
jgi:exodeoxyribonuclease VII small subunit